MVRRLAAPFTLLSVLLVAGCATTERDHYYTAYPAMVPGYYGYGDPWSYGYYDPFGPVYRYGLGWPYLNYPPRYWIPPPVIVNPKPRPPRVTAPPKVPTPRPPHRSRARHHEPADGARSSRRDREGRMSGTFRRPLVR